MCWQRARRFWLKLSNIVDFEMLPMSIDRHEPLVSRYVDPVTPGLSSLNLVPYRRPCSYRVAERHRRSIPAQNVHSTTLACIRV